MKKRTFAALALLMCLLLVLSACGVQTGSLGVKEAETPVTATGEETAVERTPIDLTILCFSDTEKDANIVRDMLSKNGFNVTIDVQASYSAVEEKAAAGNYDLIVYGGRNPARSPDYSFSNSVVTGGAWNYSDIDDSTLNELVAAAAATGRDNWGEAYGAVENYIVGEKVYQTALYQSIQGIAHSADMKEGTIHFLQIWGSADYVDESQRDTRHYRLVSTGSDFNSFDPVRCTGNAASLSTSMFIQLINLYDLDESYSYTTDGTLSRSFAISEDSQEFYFLLRDDCFFTRVNSEGEAVVSDVMVAGEDVVYSIERMRDPALVPGNVVSSSYSTISGCEIYTDLEQLKNTKTDTGESVYDALSVGLSAPIENLVDSRDMVDNDAGAYQLIRITTNVPNVQILNYLSPSSAGIVDSEWVEAINSQVDFDSYDPATDTLHGDTNALYLGDNFNNNGSYSGSYVPLYKDDSGLYFEKNDGYMTEEGGAKIRYIDYIFTDSTTTSLNLLRSGDADFLNMVPLDMFSIVEEDPNLVLATIGGSGVTVLLYNHSNPESPCSDLNVRKAIAASINQQDVIAAMGGALPAYTCGTSAFSTGNVQTYEEGKAAEYLDAYYASIE